MKVKNYIYKLFSITLIASLCFSIVDVGLGIDIDVLDTEESNIEISSDAAQDSFLKTANSHKKWNPLSNAKSSKVAKNSVESHLDFTFSASTADYFTLITKNIGCFLASKLLNVLKYTTHHRGPPSFS